ITENIFNRYKECDEGTLSKIRAHAICTDTVCKVAYHLDIANSLIMSKGEEIVGGRKNKYNIENAMEAVVGAIYLDGGMGKTKKVVNNLWSQYLNADDIILMQTNPKGQLQEIIHQVGKNLAPTYIL